ncbi:zinc transporter 1 [Aphelenchoides avenae]|nr:zinc transporter 1 [Aphelenchus avenae]
MFWRSVSLCIMLVMTFLDMIIEIVVGHLYNSTTLVADAFHMISDVLSLAVALVCVRLATHKSRHNTFGWVRLEVLGALVNGIFLVALCFSLLLDAITHFIKEEAIKEPLIVLIVGVVGLLVNVIGIVLFHEHAHGHSHGHGHSHEHKSKVSAVENSKPPQPGFEDDTRTLKSYAGFAISMVAPTEFPSTVEDAKESNQVKKKDKGVGGKVLNMRGVFLHLLSDLLGSIIVIISAGLTMIFEENKFVKFYLDPTLTIFIVLILVAVTVPLIKETAMILLETTPKDINIDAVTQDLLKIDGISTVHELHVWRLTEDKTIASVHVIFRHKNSDYIRSVEMVKSLFRDRGVNIVTVQAEFEESYCELKRDTVVVKDEKIEPVSADASPPQAVANGTANGVAPASPRMVGWISKPV